MSFFGEFKKFIMQGNVMDMAVGVVVGGAFKAIVDSLVKDIITPILSTVTGKVNIADLSLKITETLNIPYGKFLQEIINFLIIAFCIFCVVKAINTMKDKLSKKEEAEAPAPAPSEEAVILTEIRELLKKQAE